ncbi:MAG: pilus assembly protein, partial [Anaerolineae bacterium]|nr:pilus assembly protein [Anaerolineae bacterium]
MIMFNKMIQQLRIGKTRFMKLRNQRGQSLVEMAIVTPLLIFLLLGVFEVGNAVRNYMVLVNVNR